MFLYHFFTFFLFLFLVDIPEFPNMEQMRREFLSVLHDLEIHAINAFYDNKKAEIDRAISSMFNLLLF